MTLTQSLFHKAYDFYVAPERAGAYVSNYLYRLIVRDQACANGEQCAISADPWTGFQDGAVTGPTKITELSRSSNRAKVQICYALDLGNSKLTHLCSIVIAMTDERGCWVAKDLLSPSGVSLLNGFETYDYVP